MRKTKQTITPLDKPDEPPRVSLERFFSLIINVSDHPKSIYDALDYYFNEDVVKLDEGLVKKYYHSGIATDFAIPCNEFYLIVKS